MKKLVLASAVALFGLMNAQKGSVLVQGDISYNTSKTTSNATGATSEMKADVFAFNPTVGYQFTDHLTAGVKLGVGTSTQTVSFNQQGSSINTESKNNAFQYGIFGRYSMPLSDLFSVYGDLDIYATSGKVTSPNFVGNTVSYTDTKTEGFGVRFTPNLFINMKNSFGLNFNIGGIGYENSKVKGLDTKTNSFGFSFGQGVTVGISKNFK
ncbi:Outer membrane protein beta-barrel domain-containing protein [Halpernia humi]|uniref:Outer membrane protein beta-barrel domain-containing protein n=1 Tax=Halpernia humi TaxID=493375 RepID=A0A1H6BMC0_9FLAO|nr:outer membrane beta-barrel protein [Halpernia humi]SEG61557.1 Outer membrane protein beta-barrel domain-containing protein [Halpernia humi]